MELTLLIDTAVSMTRIDEAVMLSLQLTPTSATVAEWVPRVRKDPSAARRPPGDFTPDG